MQELGKELEENEEYFNDYENNRIKRQEKINKLNKLNDGLNKEKQEIEKELNKKNILIDEYKNELDILNYKHRQKIQEIEK